MSDCWKCKEIRIESRLGMPFFRCAEGNKIETEDCQDFNSEADKSAANEAAIIES